MDRDTQVMLVPVMFIKGIEDKVKHVKESLMVKQVVLSQVITIAAGCYLIQYK